ncbi:MAG: hypothetical protein CMC13_02230 [Flavobacteriaceae bacterium]|jgi:hypothetical protein|nr:hypothetical protein [Flavobacteriaceae bacterium]|tara:strand:- start:374 stop:1249 length:876 start_codon:yes stop_codon:yes gene_type:complete
MKKFTLMMAAAAMTMSAYAQTTYTQSVNPTDAGTGGVACWNSGNGEYRDNAFARTYSLEEDFGVDQNFQITQVEFGQGTGDEGTPAQINIYTVNNENLGAAAFTLISSTDIILSAANDGTVVVEDVDPAVIPVGEIAAIELFVPDSGTNINMRFFPGFNTDGQLNTAWLRSDGTGTGGTNVGCEIPYTDSNTIVADPQEYIINITGDVVLGVGDNLADVVSIFPNPAQNELNVNIPSTIEVEAVSMYDILGKDTGVQYNNGTIDLSNLARGVYILNVRTSAGTLTEKIVKQ